ncbi:TrbI/VirB10 family protein [Halodesulfovibrio marinisediminis]|uniref:Type IV secretion system protein VirB10 n=1 Tax=Halodesulfovibrio marinisediminis DSM 17456 TaxID=1121457 RepID=A0A1N6FE22_9BACT|nr:TrbI/VirB10 family protein [Halodesulfovibrio marinisediminis]SIN93510.1 type IV secretion system protein VirB10 [Halodesulfovibrio marinisediminis DSM 17456]
MSDEKKDPNGLERPKVKVVKLNRNLFYFLIFAAVGLFIFLAMEVDRSTTKTTIIQEQQKAPAPPDNKLPIENPDQSAGLAVPNDPPEEPQPVKEFDEYEPINIVQTTTRNPLLEQQRKEMAKLRQLKWQQQQQAFVSPLRSGNIPQQASQTQRSATVQQPLSAQAEVYPSAPPMPHLPEGAYNPADQKDKEAFLSKRSSGNSEWTLKHARTQGNPFELKTGAVIPGIMISGINSDLPGQLIGQVSQNVYDTATGKYLLIPQGSRMIGVYDSRVVAGQSRVLVAWNRIIFQDGSSITLGSMTGADMAGYSGFSDHTDNHYFQTFGTAALMSLISGVGAYASDTFKSDTASNNKPSLQDELGSALSSELGKSSQRLLQQNLNVQPTLTIRPGYRFNMVVQKDIVFSSPYKPWR